MNELLERSYAHCKAVSLASGSNFVSTFAFLPGEKRKVMYAVYAFSRYSDDISDEASLSGDKSALLPRWRAALDRAFEGEYGDSLILPAFHDAAIRCSIPKVLFHQLIDGVEMDLSRTRYETFEELYDYCYHVASVIGLVCLHVWGFSDAKSAYPPAEACGIAFQLTNILRDVREDAERGRIYLPLEDLKRFGVKEEDLLAGRIDESFHALMRFEAARAREYYEKARELTPLIQPVGRPTFFAMYRVYRGILARIERSGYRVFEERASCSKAAKVSIAARAWLLSRIPGGAALLRA